MNLLEFSESSSKGFTLKYVFESIWFVGDLFVWWTWNLLEFGTLALISGTLSLRLLKTVDYLFSDDNKRVEVRMLALRLTLRLALRLLKTVDSLFSDGN